MTSRDTNPTTFRAPKTERKRFVIWLWTRGSYVEPSWYKRGECETLEMAKSRIAYMQEHHPKEIEDGWVITVETTTIRHEIVEEEGEL